MKNFDIYIFSAKMYYSIRDGQVVREMQSDECPFLLWDRENGCLVDTSDINYLAVRR